jgi:flagellar hook-associated protein 1 FlgK
MKVSFNGVGFTLTGVPADGDKFSVGINDNGRGDSRNALLLGALQSGLTLDKGSTSFQGAYSQMVNDVGNKTRELEVTSAAADKMYTQTVEAQQAESGVNLDEEATNLLRYQQAYQAAGKVMQTVNQLFEMLVSMGQ